jgi:hypothetical protein
LQYVGEPEDAALRYFRLNFAGPPAESQTTPTSADAGGTPAPVQRPAVVQINGRLVHAQLRDEHNEPTKNVEQGAPIILDVLLQAARELINPRFRIHIVNEDGLVVFAMERMLEERLAASQKVHLAGRIENLLVPGRYSLDGWIRQDRQMGDMAVQGLRLTQFVVYGTAPHHGVVLLPAEFETTSLPL